MAPNIAVIYYSRNGTMHGLAEAAAAGARAGGAAVRLRQVPDDTPPHGLAAPQHGAPHQPWASHEDQPWATPEDLVWAHGIVLGTPTYFGNVSYPLKRFIDSTSPLWRAGALADRVITGMTSSNSRYGGREATLIALYNSVCHWGSLIMSGGPGQPPGAQVCAGPYGLSAPAAAADEGPGPYPHAAHDLGLRLCAVAGRLAVPVDQPRPVDGAGPPPEAGPRAYRGGRRTGRPHRSTGPVPRAAVRIAVVYHPADGALHALAGAVADGARAQGAEVRLRRVGRPAANRPTADRGAQREAPHEAQQEAQDAARDADEHRVRRAAQRVPQATPADLAWADAWALGCPARLGTVTSRLMRFIEACEPVRAAGGLCGGAATAFVTTTHPHSGGEGTLLGLYGVLHHWGAVIVPPGYTDPAVAAAGGNPYGACSPRSAGPVPDPESLRAAYVQGGRLARLAHRLRVPPPGTAPAPPPTRSATTTP